MKYEFKYGEILPDMIVDIFYDRIKKSIENNDKNNFDRWVNRLLVVNGNKIPDKIKNLIDYPRE